MSLRPAVFRLAFVFSIAATGAACVYAIRTDRGDFRLRVRDLAFSTYTADTSELSRPPAGLTQLGFLTDAPRVDSEFDSRLKSSGLTNRLDSISRIPSTVGRVQMLMATEFGPNLGVACGAITDLFTKTQMVRQGIGCCSDYTEVFLALAPAVGVFAREVNFGHFHTAAAFFAPEYGRWIFVDPFYGVMMRDSLGRFLSSREVQRVLGSAEVEHYEFVGPAVGTRDVSDPRFLALESVARSEPYVLTFGNNVIGTDAQYHRVASFPKSAAQLVGFVSGTRPHYRVYLPSASGALLAWLNARRWLALLASVAIAIGLVAWPSRLVRELVSVRRRSRRPISVGSDLIGQADRA